MAQPHAAVCSAHITAIRIVDAIDNIETHFMAFKAVEQLLSLQKAGNCEDLVHVDRASLGWLMTVLNSSLHQQIDAAKALANEQHQYVKGEKA
jgi:hypothetical protein